jgi:hypothetical protein
MRKFSGILRYSPRTVANGFLGMAYSNRWNSTDQLPCEGSSLAISCMAKQSERRLRPLFATAQWAQTDETETGRPMLVIRAR